LFSFLYLLKFFLEKNLNTETIISKRTTRPYPIQIGDRTIIQDQSIAPNNFSKTNTIQRNGANPSLAVHIDQIFRI